MFQTMTKLITPPTQHHLDAIKDIVGAGSIVSPEDAPPYLSEWRGRWQGDAALIVTPRSTQDVSCLVTYCAANAIAITPQGGNTGLVGGQIPLNGEILVSLKRMRTLRDISQLNNTMTVEAGLTLAEAQNLAVDNDRLFPLSIGSEGSCQIGGILSTNAGGVNVLRYGNMRDLVLGIEAVLPNGEVWNGLKRLRKDNTGYDLKQLFIGGEGTLGIVTAAVLKLFPLPKDKTTVLVSVQDVNAAVTLLSLAQEQTGGNVSSFELMGRMCLDLVFNNIPDTRDPFDQPHPWYVLMEFSAGENAGLRAQAEAMLARALERTLITDAVIADSEQHAQDFWHIRHSISGSINAEGLGIRLDVSVATSDMPAFLQKADGAVQKLAPGVRIVPFGHIGDGNVHYDLVGATGALPDVLEPLRDQIENAVYEIIDEFDGSISAEHGIGRHRRDTLAKTKSPIELKMMRAVKNALDPKGIMNPGKML